MNLRRALRIGSLGLVTALAGANYLPSHCALQDIIVEPTPVPTPQTSLQAEAQRLNDINPGYALTEKDLVRLARMVYFEDKFDSALQGDVEQKKGFAGVAEVIKNRFLYDTCSPKSPVQNHTCEKEKPIVRYGSENGLVGVILKENNGIHQFSSLSPKWYGNFLTNVSVSQGLYDSSFGTQEKHQMDLAYSALVGVLDGSIALQTEGALSYKNTEVTNKLNGRTVKWHDQKAFGAMSTDCNDLQYKPKKMSSAREVTCRVETDFVYDQTKKIGGHDFYTVVEGDTKEVVYADACAYVDGSYDKKMSSKKYCKNP